MRVGVVALLQESNTFIKGRTTLGHFEQELLVEGDEVRRRFADAHHEVGGFFQGLADSALEAVPIFAARALPYGVVETGVLDTLMSRMHAAINRAGPLDGLLVAPHGATVAEDYPDADGHWLGRLRERFGPGFPIIGTLDLHANLSPAMVAACDALIAYRTNPHLDQRQRGIDAAHVMARTLRGEVRPTMAGAFPRLAVNIERQLTAEPPCRPLYEEADRMLKGPGVLSNSLLLGFPYADVAEMGSAVIVVTDNDRPRAQTLADELAEAWWQRRHEFAGKMIAAEEAVNGCGWMEGPVCLLDMGDNVGGGSPGDGTFLLHELNRQPLATRAFVCIADAEAVQAARTAGIGAKVRLAVGGKTDDRHGAPLHADFNVLSFHEGRFEEAQPRHGGITKFDQGPTALVAPSVNPNLIVMLTTRRMVPFSLAQLTSCGLKPEEFHVLVAKGVHAPVAAYAPVCKRLIRVDTPGVTSADLGRLEYRRRRRPMFPFETDER